MAKRKLLKSVLNGFLHCYLSRASDYQGHWIFGHLVSDLDELRFDLLEAVEWPSTEEEVAHVLAIERFSDQLNKENCELSQVQEASLFMKRLNARKGVAGCDIVNGYDVLFQATATKKGGRHFSCEQTLFVAPYWEIKGMPGLFEGADGCLFAVLLGGLTGLLFLAILWLSRLLS